MIKILDCKSKNYFSKLRLILNKRRSGNRKNTEKVFNIIKDIKKNKYRALLKYEKKFGNNKEIKLSKKKISNSIKLLDPKIKKAIDFAYSRILKFHKNQKKPFFYTVMLSKFKNRLNKRANYVLSGGNSIRDFSNAEMIANIIFKLSKKRVGGVINIGSGKKITLLEFIKKYINRYAQITASGKSNTIAANISKLKMLSILK